MSEKCGRYYDKHYYTDHVPEEQYCVRCGQDSPEKIAFQTAMRKEVERFYQSILKPQKKGGKR